MKQPLINSTDPDLEQGRTSEIGGPIICNEFVKPLPFDKFTSRFKYILIVSGTCKKELIHTYYVKPPPKPQEPVPQDQAAVQNNDAQQQLLQSQINQQPDSADAAEEEPSKDISLCQVNFAYQSKVIQWNTLLASHDDFEEEKLMIKLPGPALKQPRSIGQIVVYDIQNRESFEATAQLIEDIKANSNFKPEVNPLYLVGILIEDKHDVVNQVIERDGQLSKVPSNSNKVISYEEAMALAQEKEISFLEIRTADRASIDQTVIKIVTGAVNKALQEREMYRVPSQMVPLWWILRSILGAIYIAAYCFGLIATVNMVYFPTLYLLKENNPQKAFKYSEAISAGIYVGYLMGGSRALLLIGSGLIYLFSLPFYRNTNAQNIAKDVYVHLWSLGSIILLIYIIGWTEIITIAFIVFQSLFGFCFIVLFVVMFYVVYKNDGEDNMPIRLHR